MSSLEVRGLVKRLGGNLVVNDINFSIEEGEFFVLLGASGGGKSTILRLICGLEQPDQGQVIIGGRDVTRLPPRDRNLGMVFQDYGLYPNMNVFQNVAYGLEARRMNRDEIQQRVTTAAKMVGLSDMIERSIVDLSGGEQQRVALARALAKDADAYLFDEPLSNLDPKLRHQARRDIMNLHRQKRKPSLYVTHDQTEAFAMADRIAIMSHGKLQQIGTTDELLQAPTNIFVAQFIGSPPMNLMDGEVRRTSDAFQISISDNLTVTLPDRWKPILNRYGKSRVVIGFRPQAVMPSSDVIEADQQQVESFMGEVENVEALIGEMVVIIKLGEKRSIAAVFQDSGQVEPNPGDHVSFALDVNQVCLFDPDSQQAIT